MTTSRRCRRSLALVTTVALLTLGAAGCSSGSDSSGEASSSGGSAAGASAPAESRAQSLDVADADTDALSVGATEARTTAPGRQSLIAKGNVALRTQDVGQGRFDVRKIVDQYDGEVAEEKTETDRDGEPQRARLVLRLPSLDFSAAMTDLKQVADVISTNTRTEDVTTQVIDTDVRVRLQRRSIERIELLLDRAESIRDIVSIEGQLSRREADLSSLEQQQAYLADQTSLATLTVTLERPPTKPEQQAERDEKGFVSGLDRGWTGLKNVTVGLLTVGGAVLPFALVALLLGAPLAWAGRSLRRRTTLAPSVPADA